MKSTSLYLCLAAILLLLSACATTPEQTESTESTATTEESSDPFVGTWILNVAKSNVNPIPKSQTLKIEAQNDGFIWAFDTVEADGQTTSGAWSGKYDGNDYPLTGNQNFDKVATRKINNNTLDSVLKNGEEVVGTGQEVISEDGNTLTLTSELNDQQGQSVSVFDRQ